MKKKTLFSKPEKLKLKPRIRSERLHPFPLLQEIIELKTSDLQEYVSALEHFGLKVKVKRGETLDKLETGISKTDVENELLGDQVLRALGTVKISNRYLKKQYRRLVNYLNSNQIKKYIRLIFFLISKSSSFKLAHLSKWQPHWYKDVQLSNKVFKLFN